MAHGRTGSCCWRLRIALSVLEHSISKLGIAFNRPGLLLFLCDHLPTGPCDGFQGRCTCIGVGNLQFVRPSGRLGRALCSGRHKRSDGIIFSCSGTSCNVPDHRRYLPTHCFEGFSSGAAKRLKKEPLDVHTSWSLFIRFSYAVCKARFNGPRNLED
jgi:hypothetical protein